MHSTCLESMWYLWVGSCDGYLVSHLFSSFHFLHRRAAITFSALRFKWGLPKFYSTSFLGPESIDWRSTLTNIEAVIAPLPHTSGHGWLVQGWAPDLILAHQCPTLGTFFLSATGAKDLIAMWRWWWEVRETQPFESWNTERSRKERNGAKILAGF